MMKEMKNKLMPMLVTLILLLSLVPIVLGVSPELRVQYDKSTLLSWNGTADVTIHALTPGDLITVRVTDGTLDEDQEYTLSIWNDDTGHVEITNGDADEKKDISFNIAVPGYEALGDNVIGTHNFTLWKGNIGDDDKVDQVDITIANYYKVKMKVGGSDVSYLYHNFTYKDDLVFYFYNWTGSGKQTASSYYKLASDSNYDDILLAAYLYEPDGTNWSKGYSEIDDGIFEWESLKFDYVASDGNMETFYWLNVTDGTQYSNVTIPIKLYFDKGDLEDTYAWDDDIEIKTPVFKEYIFNDDDENELAACDSYSIVAAIYAPTLEGYVQADTSEISTSTGKPITKLDANPMEYSAGTWYIGTYLADGVYRLNETYDLNIPGFIMYDSFTVTTDESAVLKIVDPSDIISGFNQTVNVSITNSWDDEYYGDMWLHFNGLECWYEGYTNATGGHLFDEDEVVVIGHNDTANLCTKFTDKYAYFEFNITFKETGTGTFFVTYSYNDTVYKDNNYANFESDIAKNITGELTFSVAGAGPINVIITDVPTEVLVHENAEWVNYSHAEVDTTRIEVYGEDEDTPMNASIKITGCGVDITIDEDEDTVDLAKGYKVDDGAYLVDLLPKTKGTLKFVITNGTDDYTTTKEYKINDALYGVVTTSIGDDLEITVGIPEKIKITITSGELADVHVGLFDEDWVAQDEINTSDDLEETPEDGVFEFTPAEENFESVGYIVVAAKLSTFYCYDIIEIVRVHDLVIDIITPANATRFTVGLETEIALQILDANGEVVDDIEDDAVIGEIQNSDGDVIQTVYFDENGDEWYFGDDSGEIFWFEGTLVISTQNDTHEGNDTYAVEMATIHYTPDTVTAGIGQEDKEITVTTEDANGDPLPEGTVLYLNWENATGTTTDDGTLTLDEDGAATFTVEDVEDEEGKINATFENTIALGGVGNYTNGQLTVSFPVFTITPSTIYIGRSNIVTIIAEDNEGVAIEGINLTLLGNSITQPNPVETDADGKVILEVEPTASGIANVTIARNLHWAGGELIWQNAVNTTSYVTITSIKELEIAVSKSPVFQGETLTVTITSGGVAVRDVDVEFMSLTGKTDASGEVDLTVPDPGVDFASVDITATKDGYSTETKGITVIKKYVISIVTPDEICAGESFTVTIIAKGQPLAGATVTLDGTTIKTSGGDGKVTFTAGAEGTTHTITATYESYTAGSATTVAAAKCTPGFELLTLIVAIGVAFILLRRRKHN